MSAINNSTANRSVMMGFDNSTPSVDKNQAGTLQTNRGAMKVTPAPFPFVRTPDGNLIHKDLVGVPAHFETCSAFDRSQVDPASKGKYYY